MVENRQKQLLSVLGITLLLLIVVIKFIRRHTGPPAGLLLGSGPSFFFSSGFLLLGLSLARRLNRRSLLVTTAVVAAASLALELVQPMLRITLLRGSKVTYDPWDLGASVLGVASGYVVAKLIVGNDNRNDSEPPSRSSLRVSRD